MTEEAGRQRVVFVLGRAATGDETARHAVGLAARLSAELCALFIEDEAILRVASLPRSTRVVFGASEPVGRARVEDEWRVLSLRARASVEREAAIQRVRCEFRVTRGERAQAVSSASEVADLLLFAAERAKSLDEQRPRSTPPQTGRVCVLVDDTDAGERALSVAQRLANEDRPLEVWLQIASAERRRAITQRLEAPRAGRRALRILSLAIEPRESLRAILAAAAGGILVAPASSELGKAVATRGDGGELPCWVVLTR